MVRNLAGSDADKIRTIYTEYTINTKITFEETPVTEDEIFSRIQIITENYTWLVYEKEGIVIGYPYATEWNQEPACGMRLKPPLTWTLSIAG